MKRFTTASTLILIALLFVGLVIVNNHLFDSARLDLTEGQLYTLSPGTESVIENIDEPVKLYFFFSDTTSKGMTGMRNYAERVKALLREYEKASFGKIKLEVIDPRPFSEAEDDATRFGLTAAKPGDGKEQVYFGLAATNMLDDQLVIPFFDVNKEQFLEYDLSKLLYQLSHATKPKLAMVTDMAVDGGQSPVTGQYQSPMVFFEQLEQIFDIDVIESDMTSLPKDTDVIMLAHAQSLSESLKYDIDQFAMQGGRVIVFADPHYESDMTALMGNRGANSSGTGLLYSWGIDVSPKQVLLDGKLGLDVRSNAGNVVKHPGIIGLGGEQMNREDVITANLESINLSSAGAVSLLPSSTLDMQTLLRSSDDAFLVDIRSYLPTQDPAALQLLLGKNGKQHTIAGYFTGSTVSAFGEAPPMKDGRHFMATTEDLNVMVVADADMLTDRFWVQQSQFFGQTVNSPFANNGDFVSNAVEKMAGSKALISIRSRGKTTRPFTRVETLKRAAQKRLREHEQQLRDQLAATEDELAKLQSQRGQNGALVLTDAQRDTVDSYTEKRVAIRKQLREVQYELDAEIDTLGNWLKFLNIAVAPLVLVVVLFLMSLALKLRPGKAYTKRK